jgi:Ser/Thr protein kinase RdoA (MazF antagonist)
MQGGLAATYVNMSEAEAVDLAKRRFGIEGRAVRLATEKDDTFRISPASGPRFILKVANPLENVPEIDLQIQLLDHIAARAPELPVPRVIGNDAGERHFQHQDLAGQHRQVRVMTYLEGQPLSEVPPTSSGRHQIGKLLAQLRLAIADFGHPADSRVLAWDIKHLLKLESLLGGITDVGHRKLLEAALARFASLQPRLAACRMQVLHNDFTRSNIVVDAALPGFVSGIIDFGDAVRTMIAIDVSTALLNQLPLIPEHDFFADGRDMLRGYLSVADLTAEELSLIPHLVMGRMVARALLSTALANMNPGNSTYLLRNTEPGWRQIDWFLSRSVDDVSSQLQGLIV